MKKNILLESIKTVSVEKAKEYNILALAFIGDAVHTLYVRTNLIFSNNIQSGKLHTMSKDHIKASAQSIALDNIYDILDKEEISFVSRARNAKHKTFAKNATVSDYNAATSFEALIGFLYITGQSCRLYELLLKAYEGIDNEN